MCEAKPQRGRRADGVTIYARVPTALTFGNDLGLTLLSVLSYSYMRFVYRLTVNRLFVIFELSIMMMLLLVCWPCYQMCDVEAKATGKI